MDASGDKTILDECADLFGGTKVQRGRENELGSSRAFVAVLGIGFRSVNIQLLLELCDWFGLPSTEGKTKSATFHTYHPPSFLPIIMSLPLTSIDDYACVGPGPQHVPSSNMDTGEDTEIYHTTTP